MEAYNAYSPLYLPATYAVTYLLAFALSTCVLVHTLLYHGRTLINGLKRMRIEKDDIHAKLMRNYPEVPDWWYALSFVLFFSLAIVAMEVWHTAVPVWALLLAVLIPIIYILPGGFIYAMTGQGVHTCLSFSQGTTLLTFRVDFCKLACASYSWSTSSWKSNCKHGKKNQVTCFRHNTHSILPGFQSIFSANLDRSHFVCPGPEAWSLYESPTTFHFHG